MMQQRALTQLPASDLVGRKVNLIVGEMEWNGKKYPTYKLDDPEFVADAKALYGNGVRIFVPGQLCDASVRMERIKVVINKDGIVDRVGRG